jgi:hypothetical protein
MIPTGASGSLWFNTQRIGHCKNVTININRETRRTTKQGDLDETFIKGLRSATGSALLLYDPTESAALALLREIDDDNITRVVEIRVNLLKTGSRFIELPIIVTKISASVAYGEAHTCQIEFQATGRTKGNF